MEPQDRERREHLRALLSLLEAHFPRERGEHNPLAGNVEAPLVRDLGLHPPGLSNGESFSGIAEDPPPGLIRVGPAIPAIRRLITDQDVAVFGDIARYLDTGRDEYGEYVAIDLTCSICLTSKLRLPEDVWAHDATSCYIGDEGENEGEEGVESIMVIPCGHFFGSRCLRTWIRTTERRRRGGADSDNEHDAALPEMSRRRHIPRTLPEGGAVPRLCDDCYELDVVGGIEFLCGLLFPQHVPAGDYTSPDSERLLMEQKL
ncbi:hypothetical protein F5Y17DRAFT_455751 [Xylariaceae sp. FL0594]|nr:hypothetical protein F5Y17DRAFT_455751 [Xylariaceae sp. FL0594]